MKFGLEGGIGSAVYVDKRAGTGIWGSGMPSNLTSIYCSDLPRVPYRQHLRLSSYLNLLPGGQAAATLVGYRDPRVPIELGEFQTLKLPDVPLRTERCDFEI